MGPLLHTPLLLIKVPLGPSLGPLSYTPLDYKYL